MQHQSATTKIFNAIMYVAMQRYQTYKTFSGSKDFERKHFQTVASNS